ENAAEFDRHGWGKKVVITLGHRPWGSWDNFFLNHRMRDGSPLVEVKGSTKAPGLVHYIDEPSREQEFFFSQDHKLMLWCGTEPKQEGRFPYCELKRPYKYKIQNGNSAFAEFNISYTFSRDYLQQWREIDVQVQALFDRFAASAQQN
ncbi:MAG: hypothetical protein C0406_10545, partial [Sideroxydans sp.]|nr:hypothetical protein [Sideroxydans sp.]